MKHRNHGMALVLVLVVTAIAAMLAASLMYRLRAEVAASTVSNQGEQAWQIAMAGLHQTIDLLREAGNDPMALYDAPDWLGARPMSSDGAERWYFSVYATNDEQHDIPRFGVTDLAGLINVNTADEVTLLALPGMTSELAEALLDYIDGDSDARPQGAEQDWYDQLPRPYLIANGPLTTIDELLLVRGFTASVVYGEDANLNGLLDPNEDDSGESFPPDDGDGRLDRGMRGWLTASSWAHPAITTGPTAGMPRLDLNGDLQGLDELGLPELTVTFIRAYREDGRRFVDVADLLGMRHETAGGSGRSNRANDSTQNEPAPEENEDPDADPDEPRQPAPQPNQRSNQGSRQAGGQGTPRIYDSGVGREELAMIMDRLMVADRRPSAGGEPPAPDAAPASEGTNRQTGRVNVNTASATVLACLPGLDEDLARQIVDTRSGLEDDARGNLAWLHTMDILDAVQFRQVAPRLTTLAGPIHLRVVGYGLPSGRYCVIEAVVDVSLTPARIVYLRDLTRLGAPFVLRETP